MGRGLSLGGVLVAGLLQGGVGGRFGGGDIGCAGLLMQGCRDEYR